jgi:hypothetical protein
VIDADDGHPQGCRYRFRACGSDRQTGGESRAASHRNLSYGSPGRVSFGAFKKGPKAPEVFTRRDVRDDATMPCVKRYLAVDPFACDPFFGVKKSERRLVAGALESENHLAKLRAAFNTSSAASS